VLVLDQFCFDIIHVLIIQKNKKYIFLSTFYLVRKQRTSYISYLLQGQIKMTEIIYDLFIKLNMIYFSFIFHRNSYFSVYKCIYISFKERKKEKERRARLKRLTLLFFFMKIDMRLELV
jgi:hypothetical protein